VSEVIKPVEESKPVEDNKESKRADVTETVTEKAKVVADDDEVM